MELLASGLVWLPESPDLPSVAEFLEKILPQTIQACGLMAWTITLDLLLGRAFLDRLLLLFQE